MFHFDVTIDIPIHSIPSITPSCPSPTTTSVCSEYFICCNTTPNVDDWRAGVVSALQAYGADQSDANWDAVVDAFVNGWAVQYAAANN